MTDGQIELRVKDTANVDVILHGKSRAVYGERFMTVFPATTDQLAAMKRTDGYWRCMLWGLGHLDAIQHRQAIRRQITRDTGLSQRSVERAVQELVADNLWLPDLASEGHPRYRLNMALGWTSTARKRNARMADDSEPPIDDSRIGMNTPPRKKQPPIDPPSSMTTKKSARTKAAERANARRKM